MKNKENWVEFTGAILAHLLVTGYKGLKVENYQQYVLIEPVRDLDCIDAMANNNAYIIPISDIRAYEITKKVLMLDMNFYIDQNFIQ